MKAIAKLFAVAVLAVAVTGCVSQPLGKPQPSMQTLETLRSSDLPAMKVGTFAPAPSLKPSADKSVSMRALTLTSPEGGSFAKYLGKTIEVDLQAAGKYDAASDLVLDGLLTASDVSAPIGTGHGELGAKFSLSKAGKPVFEKTLKVTAEWPSAFIGAEAIPDAANNYALLYDKLAATLFTDQDFRAAAKAQK